MKGAMSPEYYCFRSILPSAGFAHFFAGTALKPEKKKWLPNLFFCFVLFFFSTFNPCPLLQPVATDDRKQF